MTTSKIFTIISIACFMAGAIISLMAHNEVLALVCAGLMFNSITKL